MPAPREGSPPRCRLARGLRDALDEAGVSFVKLGQLLATRHRAAPVPWLEVRRILEEDLGPRLSEFEDIEETPLAAASWPRSTGRAWPAESAWCSRSGGRASRCWCAGTWRSWTAGRGQLRTAWGRSIGAQNLAEGFAESLRGELDFRRELMVLVAVFRDRPSTTER